MTPMMAEEMTALRGSLLSLAESCPVDRSNPADCPLFAVRKIGPARRLQWFNGLDGDDLVYLNAYHCICEQIRRQPRLPGTGNVLRVTSDG